MPRPPHWFGPDAAAQAGGYRTERDKFGVADLSVTAAEIVCAPRVEECPVQLEAVLETSRSFGHRPDEHPTAITFEVRIVRAHIEESILIPGTESRVDPDKWRPLIMNFC